MGYQVSEVVSIQSVGSAENFALVHVCDQELAHGVRGIYQDVAAQLRRHQMPKPESLLARQTLQHESDARWMQVAELLRKLYLVLAGNQEFDYFLLVQQLADLLQCSLDIPRLLF